MIVRERIQSRHLAGNLLSDPAERDVFVYVPPGHEDCPHRHPAAYLLHAFGSDARSVVTPPTDQKRWTPPIEDVLDPVFRRMQAPPMLVVIPDGWTSYGCSQWVDSPVHGNFEKYVTQEVVSFVDERFCTIRSAEGRGVFGFSSGGFGAWHLASRNPSVFGAAALLSADSYFDLTHKPILYAYYESIWPEAPGGPTDSNDSSHMAYALGACYSPNVERAPFYVDLPVEWPSGQLLPDVWDRWLSYDPVVNWRERSHNLRELRGLLLDVGWNDDVHLQWGHRLLSHHLSKAGIPHDVTENAGNHGGRERERYQAALAWLADKLAPAREA